MKSSDLDTLISWLEKQPADKTYGVADTSTCLLAQYFKAHGFADASTGMTIVTYVPQRRWWHFGFTPSRRHQTYPIEWTRYVAIRGETTNLVMNVLDLFSGIGGFSLGLERAGMRTVAFCEIEPFCRAVLKKHWPHVPCYDDVRNLTANRLKADGISVDVICGGFPCQDISTAGRGAGIEGERSGLWKEYARLIGELRPRYVIVENVAALLSRGLDVVLGDLATLGFDAEWHCIPASAVGAPHRRDRLWLVANPSCRRCRQPDGREIQQPGRAEAVSTSETLADTIGSRQSQPQRGVANERRRPFDCGEEISLADSNSRNELGGCCPVQVGWGGIARKIAADGEFGRTQWSAEPNVGRVAHGISNRVDRLGGLGNAVVPQIPEIIGRAIMNAQRS